MSLRDPLGSRKRLDNLLVELGYASSREKSQALILSGGVLVNGRLIDKPSYLVKEGERIEVKERIKYVSRAGYKLEHAIESLGLDVRDYVVLDVGSSTGGFTDCLLQKGAKKVYAVDVGKAQMDYKLRHDERVILYEETDARSLSTENIPEKVDLITMDVSFISATKILPHVVQFLKDDGVLLVLVKPQFELEPKKVPKGIVRKDEYKKEAIIKVAQELEKLSFKVSGIIKSKPRGSKGNEEFFLLAGRYLEGKNLEEEAESAVKQVV